MLQESQVRPPAYYLYNQPVKTMKGERQGGPTMPRSSAITSTSARSISLLSRRSKSRKQSVHSQDSVTDLASQTGPLKSQGEEPQVLILDEVDSRANKVFLNTGLTYKTAIKEGYQDIKPTRAQLMKRAKQEHRHFLGSLFKEDPVEKMDYLRAKFDCVRVTGALTYAKKPKLKTNLKEEPTSEKSSARIARQPEKDQLTTAQASIESSSKPAS